MFSSSALLSFSRVWRAAWRGRRDWLGCHLKELLGMNRRRTWESIEFQVSRTESNAFYIALLKRRLSVVFNIHHSLDQVKERKGSESNDPTQRIASLFFLSPPTLLHWPNMHFTIMCSYRNKSRFEFSVSSLLLYFFPAAEPPRMMVLRYDVRL